jgi:NADPH:quinone reductase-like Zn-dependent oxidoreductase
MNDNRAVAGVNMGHLWGHTELLMREMHALLELFSAGAIKPHIGATYPFSRAADAHAELEERRNMGKVLLIPD